MDSITTRFSKEVFDPYLDLLKSGYRFHSNFSHAEKIWKEKLAADELVNGPYLEKSQIYHEGANLAELPLHDKTKNTINKRLNGRNLYHHQTEALKSVLAGKNTIIATGTSSGKTLCYQIPILDDLIRNPEPGLRAVIIYPLNALVNDQLTEWEEMLTDHPEIRFARFTGQTPNTQTDYIATLKESFRSELAESGLTQQEIQQAVEKKLAKQREKDIPNRLNHRDAIRSNPPQVLITNFSMLEYLLERPIDAAIFKNARLQFLVLDEVHAYRGVQATEIAFLIRRLKDRLQVKNLTCIGTSATLGKQGDPESQKKVRKFGSDIFGENVEEPNPIYGVSAEPMLLKPFFSPSPEQYLEVAEGLRKDPNFNVSAYFKSSPSGLSTAELLAYDENLYRLRKDILTKPILLKEAANKLWPQHENAVKGLEALLEVVAVAKSDQTHEDLLPTRLHYFVRAQDGLHICLRLNCPARKGDQPAFFVSRKNRAEIPEGDCPECYVVGYKSKLVEIVSCRRCGYLYGTLKDLGPTREQDPNYEGEIKPHFDSFSTELGWAGDSFWTYFSTDKSDLPYPQQSDIDIDEDENNLISNPDELVWCTVCGKKSDDGVGDNCLCGGGANLRSIKVFHRQCPQTGKAKDRDNLSRQEKTLLKECPNCSSRNGSGIEPVHRFQESDDEMGLAMAIPLAHFQVSVKPQSASLSRKLLCFTDHRQRAAAFPSLLEEETFTHDMGRKIIEILEQQGSLDLISLGDFLADEEEKDHRFFLPVSRYPDEDVDAKTKRNLWLAETFAYFGVPDSARESVEDFGLVSVEYRLKDEDKIALQEIFKDFSLTVSETNDSLQVLFSLMRQRKAFTLPRGRVQPDDPAFGPIPADIGYVKYRKDAKDQRNSNGWLPRVNKDGSTTTDNIITDFLRRALSIDRAQVLPLAEAVWDFLLSRSLLIENKNRWQLDHQKIFINKPTQRYVCDRCSMVTAYSVKNTCPRKVCKGHLQASSFDPLRENKIARWVSGQEDVKFFTLKSEEHTAQINKNLAKQIEDRFRYTGPSEAKPTSSKNKPADEGPRDEGINLLSSTTTFEMGINIGDLQKVLLRNAPPSSASYVQRVGRAGRGRDKNSVCVTLCRRTKYDADAWNEPPRLMSGEVRTPTVFIQNRIIAQRHFNAVVFAKFLRTKLVDENALGPLKQQIRLAGFITPIARENIPDTWIQIQPTNTYLDFIEWLKKQNQSDIFQDLIATSLLDAVAGFDVGISETAEKYKFVLENISDELLALMEERSKLYNLGSRTSDVEQAIKNLLNSDIIAILAKRGFLPRYAFPLDVVALETGKTRWSRDADVELSRDRGQAIAEFAPGAQVIARKKVFTSAGLYVGSKKDEPKKEWYSECPSCKQIRTGGVQDGLLGPCNVCQQNITSQYIKAFVAPLAFSIRVDDKGPVRYRRSTLIRQRQSLTHFIDHIEDSAFKEFGLFDLALKETGSLFRYNLGPENKGFMLCPQCGCSESLRSYRPGRHHKKLRSLEGSDECNNMQPWAKPLAYGHQFQSYCLIARPKVSVDSIESLAYGLQKGLCKALDLEVSDIGVSWRWLPHTNAEIVLYDQTPGGAGFVREGYENWDRVIQSMGDICEKCTCEHACYDCLKNYGNQSQHDNLNRYKVLDFLRLREDSFLDGN